MLTTFRSKHPEYDDMPDADLMAALHRKFYSDMPEDEFMAKMTPRPDHDDLENCAVRGEDSLELQDIDPEVKPAVKMTVAEFLGAQIPTTKPFFSPGNGSVYVFSENAPNVKESIESILEGDDSEILGYPEKGPLDAAVTKQGEVVTDLPTMRQHAENGNVMWAANGEEIPLMEKAGKVASAIRGQRGRS